MAAKKQYTLTGLQRGAIPRPVVAGSGPGGRAIYGSSVESFSKFATALTSLNVVRDPTGGSLAALMAAVEGTAVKSVTGLVEGQASVDYSDRGLTVMDAKIVLASRSARLWRRCPS